MVYREERDENKGTRTRPFEETEDGEYDRVL